MWDEWRTFLYLPLGLIPSLFFSLRMYTQWIQSERQRQSTITPLFWRLSLWGQGILTLHFILQVHYPLALIQATNFLISWRNLDLMGKKRLTFNQTLCLLFFGVAFITALFLLQSYFIIGEIDWIRTPKKLWDSGRVHHSFWLHMMGTMGVLLFATRFWIQWWKAEKNNISYLPASFWWISITGNFISLIYFLILGDTINIINCSFSTIPYLRNLMLIRRRYQ